MNALGSIFRLVALALLGAGVLLGTPAVVRAAVSDQDVAALSAQADEKGGAPESKLRDDGPSLGALAARMAVALGVVFALMTGVLWVARRYMPQVAKSGRLVGSGIEVLSTRSLGQRRSLILVRARDKTLLLGVTPQTISTLAELGEEGASWQEVAFQSGLHEDEPRRGSGTTSMMEDR